MAVMAVIQYFLQLPQLAAAVVVALQITVAVKLAALVVVQLLQAEVEVMRVEQEQAVKEIMVGLDLLSLA
jgi:hypothetical protein